MLDDHGRALPAAFIVADSAAFASSVYAELLLPLRVFSNERIVGDLDVNHMDVWSPLANWHRSAGAQFLASAQGTGVISPGELLRVCASRELSGT